jgi:perosamine synthetase
MAKARQKITVPLYRLPYSEADIRYVQREIAKVLKRGYLTDGGDYLKHFEESFARWIGAGEAVAVNSATTALEIILRGIGIEGGSVIVPTYTFYATPLSVLRAGGSVVYADINRDTLSLSLESIEKHIRPDTRVVIVVHVGGVVSSEIEAIRKLCRKRKVYLIEDAACAHGAGHKGKMAGTFGDAAAFSFHHSKVLTTGEGGMIITLRQAWLKEARLRRAIGIDRSQNNWEVRIPDGSNYKMSEITAVLGLLHLKNAGKIIRERRRIAAFYDKHIKFNDLVMPFKIPPGSVSSYYKYIVLVNEPRLKGVLRRRLAERGVNLPPNLYDHLCHDQNVTKATATVNSNEDFPESEYMRDHHVCLPMYNGLTKRE